MKKKGVIKRKGYKKYRTIIQEKNKQNIRDWGT